MKTNGLDIEDRLENMQAERDEIIPVNNAPATAEYSDDHQPPSVLQTYHAAGSVQDELRVLRVEL